MAAASWQQSPLLRALVNHPQAFDFFQAIRLLDYAHHKNIGCDKNENQHQKILSQDWIQFGVFSKNVFPVAAIEKIDFLKNLKLDNRLIPFVQINFMGLTGVRGVLPEHYTERLLMSWHQGDHVVSDFFDMFHHRLILLFYGAWKKNHFWVNYELNQLSQNKTDVFTQMVQSFSGVPAALSENLPSPKANLFKFYASLFSKRVRSAFGLESLLGEYFKLPIQILPFQGRWLMLEKFDCSIIGIISSLHSQYHELGKNMVLGQRRWCVQNNFTIVVGPLKYSQFEPFSPDKKILPELVKIVKWYINKELNFNIQFELMAKEVPFCQISHQKKHRLAWNAWLGSMPLKKNGRAVVSRLRQ